MEIDTIRQIAKEKGVDLGIQGLVCLPRELKKYIGFITRYHKKGGGVTYMARIQYENLKSNVTFETEVGADQYIRNSTSERAYQSGISLLSLRIE